jgi:hypothetical protein
MPMGEVGTEAAPQVDVEVETATKVDDVARAALERADRGGKRDKKKSEPTAETREFWETWAEEKSTRPAPEPKAEAPAAEESSERPARGRDRGGRDKERGGRDRDKGSRSEKRSREDTKLDKPERGTRSKRDTEQTPAAAPSADSQARLFVSLGKKHGVSADDLRELLAGPIGGDKTRIGSVSLRDSHAHVRVPEDLVDDIIAGVNGKKHDDHEVTVERSRA